MHSFHRVLILAVIWPFAIAATAQTEPNCSYNPDFDSDGLIGVTDLMGFLSFFGNSNSAEACSFGPDLDCDGICDAFDDCIGEVDECGLCGGNGPYIAIIDTIVPIIDSVFIEVSGEYHVYQAWADTSYTMICPTLGCTDAASYLFNPAAHLDDGSCEYSSEGCADGTMSVTFDGYAYDLITIGDQCWFAENLRTTIYANSDIIPFVPETSEWLALQDNETGAWCHAYGDSSSLDLGLGLQYNFYSVEDGRNTCPVGWHVPTDNDWKVLESELGLDQDSLNFHGYRGYGLGSMLKADSNSSVPWDGNNSTGFDAMASGHRTGSGGFHGNNLGLYWTSTPWSASAGTYRSFYTNNSAIRRTNTQQYASGAIRCIRNADSECFDGDEDGVCPVDEVYGCIEEGALNYNPEATEPAVCETIGCMDEAAYNFDVRAVEDDGSCAYAIPGCSDGTMSVTFDGHEYGLVTIGDQCWFTENLRTTIYANGDSIFDDLTPYEWSTAHYGETSASTVYSDPNDSTEADSLINLFGRLYNGFAASDGRSVCPSGWKVPTDSDWVHLETSLGLVQEVLLTNGWRGDNQGNTMKADSSEFQNWNASNTTGLNIAPSGQRSNYTSDYVKGGTESWLWALPDSTGDLFRWRILSTNNGGINRRECDTKHGMAVRCVRNEGSSCFDPDGDGICPADEVAGCTEPTASNYSDDATEDDGSCVWENEYGCADGSNNLLFEGYEYRLVQIGDDCWFAENLRTTHFANGDSIPFVTSNSEWAETTTAASAIFFNNTFSDPYEFGPTASYLERFGMLYNWHAASDERNVCPEGWHVPSHEEEFASMSNYIASLGITGVGSAIKANPNDSISWNGRNQIGFDGLPGGDRSNEGAFGTPYPSSTGWWTTTETEPGKALAFGVSWQATYVYSPNVSKNWGHYIRCVRN